MPRNLKICYRAGVGEILEKKSRFIANIAMVSSEEEALEFIDKRNLLMLVKWAMIIKYSIQNSIT